MLKIIAIAAALALAAPVAASPIDDALARLFNGPGQGVDLAQWNNPTTERLPSAQCGQTTSGDPEWCEPPFYVDPPTTPPEEPCLFMADHDDCVPPPPEPCPPEKGCKPTP